MNNLYVIYLLFVVFAIALSQRNDFEVGVEITSVDRDSARFSGGDVVTIEGKGFKSFSQVTCLWDFKWASFNSYIESDRVIKCETPKIEASEFEALIKYTSLEIIFNGDDRFTYPISHDFSFGPIIDDFTPKSGFTGGGEEFTITGTNFNDFETAEVYFDKEKCNNVVITNDNEIKCQVPEGTFNQNAVVNVVFGGNDKFYYHFEETYHYGPVFNQLTPPCGSYIGGTTVIITGENLNDPIISQEAAPANQILNGIDINKPQIEVVIRGKRYIADREETTFDGTQIEFITPEINDEDVFGESVEIFVYFKNLFNKVQVNPPFSFRYGPIIYSQEEVDLYFEDATNPSPNSGHRAGGDVVAIIGCGFSNFTEAQINPILYTGANRNIERSLCIRGDGPGLSGDSLVLDTCSQDGACEQILCFTAPFDCTPDGTLDQELVVEFTPIGNQFNGQTKIEPRGEFDIDDDLYYECDEYCDDYYGDFLEEKNLKYALGPIVESLSQTRGSYKGGETITVTGKNFLSNGFVSTPEDPGWVVTVNFDVGYNHDIVTVPVTIISDTEIEFVTPTSGIPWNSVAIVDFSFDSTCLEIPRDKQLTFHFGPTCDSIVPTNDWLIGNRPVTLSGEGLLEGVLTPETDMDVLMCIQRLNNGLSSCDVNTVINQSTVSGEQITFNTPDAREGVERDVGYNRLFGDVANFAIRYNNVPAEDLYYLETEAILYCSGGYTFGPETLTINPKEGPMGPRGFELPGTKITIEGTAFNDPIYNDNIVVAIGKTEQRCDTTDFIETFNSKVDGFNADTLNKRITAFTNWGGLSNSDADVVTIFNTCNTTVADADTIGIMKWGPEILSISGINGATINLEDNENLDVYGVVPFRTDQTVTVTGEGFSEYYNEQFELFFARCNINGRITTATYVSDTEIICNVPVAPYGTVATISVEFGTLLEEEFFDDDCDEYSNEYDDNNEIYFYHYDDEYVVIYGDGEEIPYYYQYFDNYYDDDADRYDFYFYFFNDDDYYDDDEVNDDDTSVFIFDNFENHPFGSGINYKNILTASQKLIYAPRIISFTPDYGKTSGNTQVTITGEGFNNWNSYECHFGHYPASSDAVVNEAGTQITCSTPLRRGEFNTDVFVHVKLNNENSMKVVAHKKYHYGPVCNNITPTNGYINGGYDGQILGDGFIDCLDSNEDAPFSNCTFSQIIVRFGNRDIGNFEEIQVNGVSENAIDITFPPSENLACQYEPTVDLFFVDAIVTDVSQKTVECNNDDRDYFFHYGPLFTEQTSEFKREDISYGWQDDFVYIHGLNFADPAIFGEETEDVVVFFGSTPAVVNTVTDTMINCTVPSGSWDSLVDLTVAWNIITFPTPSPSTTASLSETASPTISNTMTSTPTFAVVPSLSPSNSLVPSATPGPSRNPSTDSNNEVFEPSFGFSTCTGTTALKAEKFHFGPVLDSISESRGYVGGQNEVRISGYAFSCCGIVDIQECLFPDFTLPDPDFTLPLPFDDDNSSSDVDDDSIICTIPPNTQIDKLMRNLGLVFNSTLITSNTARLFQTESGESLDYYYGPLVNDVNPKVHSLSAISEIVTFTGAGFQDPYLSLPLCEFDVYSISTDNFKQTYTTTATTVSDTSITCPIPEYVHECGDFSEVRLVWTRETSQFRPNLGFEYFKTEVSVQFTNTTQNIPPFFIDLGSQTPIYLGPIVAGPVITDVSVVDDGSASLRSSTRGGLIVDITFDDLSDWTNGGVNFDFGSQTALCVFGDRFSLPLSTIGENNVVRCQVPSGAFDYSGEISVILDPHLTVDTILSPIKETNEYFTWTPYADSISRPFGTPFGYESITVQGEGFSNYDTVVCNFGGIQAFKSNIVDDNTVVCITPPISDAGAIDFTLNFNDFTSDIDTTLHLNQYNVAGISSFEPNEGPRCGNTQITIKGHGFNLFDFVECRFDGQYVTAGSALDDNTVVCVTPDVSSHQVGNPVNCINVEVIGHYEELGTIALLASDTFEFGNPEVISFDPTSSHVEARTEIVIKGEFFNGGAEFGVYSCLFGDYPPQPASIHSFYEDDDEEKFVLVCNTPVADSFNDIKIGTVPLEIEFDCSTTSTTFNRIPFTFFQTPDIDDYFPIQGPEIGGTLITVEGENFVGGTGYFCSFGTLGIDNELISATFNPEDNTLTCYSPSRIVSTTTPVDFGISIDGGETIILAPTPFRYGNINRECTNASSSVYSSNSFLLISLSFILFFFFY
eukprot:TRINITY_DN310_c5_g1_i1.p1 TRINITY_DN310_c5_g1~~TRINITY_DN310_c5_g1_i1.p1  ORF type:complete len:2261 (+),score=904.66 TRINITY_DN310_c5_g1_i1:118-6783(+)